MSVIYTVMNHLIAPQVIQFWEEKVSDRACKACRSSVAKDSPSSCCFTACGTVLAAAVRALIPLLADLGQGIWTRCVRSPVWGRLVVLGGCLCGQQRQDSFCAGSVCYLLLVWLPTMYKFVVVVVNSNF